MFKQLMNRGKCAVGIHEGEWERVQPGRCDERRVCVLCGEESMRLVHDWGQWGEGDGCLQVRQCRMCGESESREQHTFEAWVYTQPGDCTQQIVCRLCSTPGDESRITHAWDSWFYSEENRGPVRACTRCRAMVSPFPHQATLVQVAPLESLTPTSADEEALVRLLDSGDVAAQRTFFDLCPDHPLKAQVLPQLDGSRDLAMIMANLLMVDCSYGRAPALAAKVSRAVYRLAREAHASSGNVNDIYSAEGAATNLTRALASTGQHEEALRVAREAQGWLDSAATIPPQSSNRSDLALLQVESLLALGQYDAAEEALVKAVSRADWEQLLQNRPADRQRAEGLKARIVKMKQEATTLPQDVARTDQEQFAAIQGEIREMLAQLQQPLDSWAAKSETADAAGVFGAFSRRIEEAMDADAPDSLGQWVLRNQGLMDDLADVVGGADGEMNQVHNQQRIRNAALIFHDPAKAYDPQTIAQSRDILEEALGWLRERGFIEDENDALWTLYICYNRLDEPERAIERLQALRANIETMRSQIADAQERAGLMAQYPHLFGALCYLLNKVGDTAGLLEAMEGAKGRVLADVLTARRGEVVADRPFAAAAAETPVLMQAVSAAGARSHYLSFFVDEEETYVVLVAADGSLHRTAIPVGHKAVREWANDRDPKGWKVRASKWFGGASQEPLTERLVPLVAWLEPLLEAGVLQEGDHLCYCPDAELHLIPLHYITFRGQPLVHAFSVSRIHSARALALILERDPAPPAGTLAVAVPAAEDLGNAEKLMAFKQAVEWLLQARGGQRFVDTAATWQMVATAEPAGKIVHFATHGIFPEKRHPFRHSGLVLAQAGHLPQLDAVSKGQADDLLLTPERALAIDFGGSHVTLQACVSGLATEGIGGDALGLEWALLQAGTQSLLTTHWFVPAIQTAAFSETFYHLWLQEGQSRAAAWRGAMLALMEAELPAEYPPLYYCAGFTLSGDWR